MSHSLSIDPSLCFQGHIPEENLAADSIECLNEHSTKARFGAPFANMFGQEALHRIAQHELAAIQPRLLLLWDGKSEFEQAAVIERVPSLDARPGVTAIVHLQEMDHPGGNPGLVDTALGE